MPRVYLCDFCHKQIEENDKFVIHNELDIVFTRRLHAGEGDKDCITKYREAHPTEFSN